MPTPALASGAHPALPPWPQEPIHEDYVSTCFLRRILPPPNEMLYHYLRLAQPFCCLAALLTLVRARHHSRPHLAEPLHPRRPPSLLACAGTPGRSTLARRARRAMTASFARRRCSTPSASVVWSSWRCAATAEHRGAKREAAIRLVPLSPPVGCGRLYDARERLCHAPGARATLPPPLRPDPNHDPPPQPPPASRTSPHLPTPSVCGEHRCL